MADRIDWPSILQKLGSPAAAGEPSLFVFSEGARLLLLALAERLTWRATYRIDGYDYADWDMVQQFGEEALFILAGGLKMEEITNRLDVIINLLREQPLCCADGPIPPNPPNITKNTPNGVPQGVIENGWASDNNDWSGYNDYLCEAATALVRSLKSTLLQLQTFVERGSLSTAVLLALVAGAFAIGGLVFPMALAVAGSIVSIVVSTADIVDLWGTAIDELTTYEREFVCAIISTTDSDNAVNGFSGIIDVRISSPVMRTIIYRIPFERGIRAIMAGEYNGEYIALTESTGADCSDCQPPAPPAPVGYKHVRALPTVGNTWVSSSTTPVATVNGNSVDVSASSSATGTNHYVDVVLSLSQLQLADNEKVIGVRYTYERINNIAVNGHRILTPHPDSTNALYNGSGVVNASEGVQVILRHENHGVYQVTTEQKRILPNVNLNGCKPQPNRIRLGAYNAAAGAYSFRVKDFYWVVAVGQPCA